MVLCNTAPNWFWQFVSLFALFDTGMFWCSRNLFHHGFQYKNLIVFPFYFSVLHKLNFLFIFYSLLRISEKISFLIPSNLQKFIKKCSFIPFQTNLPAILRRIVKSSSSNMKHIKSHSPQKKTTWTASVHFAIFTTDWYLVWLFIPFERVFSVSM